MVRSAIGAVPIIGSSAAEYFNELVQPPLEARKLEWMEKVGEGLRKLEESSRVRAQNLREDPEFIDTVLQATQTAMRNCKQEKLDALRNAILNTAIGIAPQPALREMFLRYIDDFTVWHMKLLDLFADVTAWYARHSRTRPSLSMGALEHILEDAFPSLRGQRSFYDQVWKDLYSRALVGTDSLHTMMTGTGLVSGRCTELGKQFLSFIKEIEL
jgi:hypothetical protein